MRADNTISIRVPTIKKRAYQQAAKLDQQNVTQWLINLADQRIKEQRDEILSNTNPDH